MKIILALPLLLLLCMSCQKEENIKGFYVTADTLNISLPGKVSGGVKLADRYYMNNWDYKNYKSDYGFLESRLCILDKNGKLIDTISPHSEMYLSGDLLVRKDSIILNDTERNRAIYLDEKNREYIRLQKAYYTLFEDNSYRVTSCNFGEWGGATWFKDKKTGIQYEVGVIMPEIHKINNMYYLLSSEGIDIVKNPRRMSNMGINNYGEGSDTINFKTYYSRKRPTDGRKGVERIFKNTMPKYDDYYKSNMLKSFVHNDSLYFIYRDTKTFIAKMHGRKMIPVLILQDISVAPYSNTYRNTDELTIPFKNDKTGKYGMLEIKNDTIYLHYISNYPPKN